MISLRITDHHDLLRELLKRRVRLLKSAYDRITHLDDPLILLPQDQFQCSAKFDIVVDSHSTGTINYHINMVMPSAERTLPLDSLLDLRDCEASTFPNGTIPDDCLHMSEPLLENPARSGPTESKFKKQNPDSCNHEISDDNRENDFRPSPPQAAAQAMIRGSTGGSVLLLIAVSFTTTSFIGILICPCGSADGSSFSLIDSAALFASLAWIIKLMHKLALMLWLLLSVFSIIGAYICVITANHPHEVVPVSLIGSCVLLTAFLPYLELTRKPLSYLKRIRRASR